MPHNKQFRHCCTKKCLHRSYLIMILAALLSHRAWRVQKQRKRQTQLKGQVAIITGASGGIGAELARELAAQGTHLVLAARRLENLESLKAELEQTYGIDVLALRCDVTQKPDVADLIEQSFKRFGHVDILVNNAGIADYGYIATDSIEAMREVMEVNYWGVIQCTQSILPHFKQQQAGYIVNIASTAAHISVPGMVNYAASKHAVRAFSDGLRLEVARYGIRVLTVCPTSTQTEIIHHARNQKAINIDPDNYPGMTAQRVAKETVQALCQGKREHLLGLGEQIAVALRYRCPALVDVGLKLGARYLFKEK